MSVPPESEAAERQRVFFALWPPAEVQRALAGLAATCAAQVRGKLVPEANLHVTLAFLGEIPAPAVAVVSDAAAAVEVEPFRLTLDRLGFWRRAGIVWAGARETPAPLEALVSDLQGRLARLGFPPEHRDYQPHVTLLRRATRRPRVALEPLSWDVDGFCLVRSWRGDRGSVYRVIGEWPPG